MRLATCCFVLCFLSTTFAEQLNFTGYLIDLYCWNLPNHVALNGANLQFHPEQHTVKCLSMKVCKETGYAVLAPKGTDDYTVKYKFDENTNYNVESYLETKQEADTNIIITVIGNLGDNQTLTNGKIVDPLTGNVFANCIGPSTKSSLFYYLHALVMVYAWAIAAPFSFVIVRYYKHHHHWLYWHQFFAQSTLIGASSALFTVVSSEKSFFERMADPHAIVGGLILTLSCFQFLLGTISAFGIKSNQNFSQQKAVYYRRCKRLHRTLGPILLLCGLIQLFTGSSWYPTLFACLSVWVCLLLGLILYKEYHWQRAETVEQVGIFKALEEICERKVLPSYTQQEFRSKISTGSRWVIVGNTIVDIEEWTESHPGGAQLLRLHIGLDVTEQLTGGPIGGHLNDDPSRFHRHSNAALKLLHNRVQGRLLVHDKNGSNAAELRQTISFAKLLYKERVCDVSAPIVKFVFELKGVKRPDLIGSHYLFVGTDESYHIFERPYTPIQVLDVPPAEPSNSGKEHHQMVEFYIRLYPNGAMSRFLASLEIGSSRLRMSGPHAKVSHSKLGDIAEGKYDHVGFLTAGTGIVVFLQVLDTLMSNHVHCHLLWQIRDSKEIFECPELEKHLCEDKHDEEKHRYLQVDYIVTLTPRPAIHLTRNNATIASFFDTAEGPLNFFRRHGIQGHR